MTRETKVFGDRELRDRTVLGAYRIDVWQETSAQYAVEVYQGEKLVRGPFRYVWLHQAVDGAHDLTERLRVWLEAKHPRALDAIEKDAE